MDGSTLFLSFFIFILTTALEDILEITVKPGDDVTLPCQSPNDAAITLLEWSRPEMKADGYVFFYRNDRSYENYHHATVLGRVQLRNASAMKHGDVSVILKNVNINDTGTYECRIITSKTEGRERDHTETKRVVHLTVAVPDHTAGNTRTDGDEGQVVEGQGVEDEGKKDGYSGSVVGVSVAGVLLLLLLVGVAGFMFFRRRKEAVKHGSYQIPPD